jgi:hypothetical protein
MQPMTIDPEEFVTLSNHGTMKLRSAVVRAMILPAEERTQATIVREGEPRILRFEQTRALAAQWEFVPSDESRPIWVAGAATERDERLIESF